MRGDMPFCWTKIYAIFFGPWPTAIFEKKNQNKEIYKNWCNAALWISLSDFSLSGFPCQTRSVTVPRFGFFHRFTDKGTVPLGRLSKKRALNEVKSRKKTCFWLEPMSRRKKLSQIEMIIPKNFKISCLKISRWSSNYNLSNNKNEFLKW